MGICIYSNGIVEEILPIDNTFSDDELTKSFDDYTEIMTHRLHEIPNCWCVWGHIENPPDHEFSKLGSEIVDADVFSHILLIHDSELDPEWNLTDHIIYRPYSDFMKDIGVFINEMMENIQIEHREELEVTQQNSSMIFLSTLGHTEDKRVLFAFNPHEQNDSFYDDGGWDKFGSKIWEYISENFWEEPIEENKPFVIYADTKTIVIIEDKHVDVVVSNLIKKYQTQEQYEVCSKISEIKEEWYMRKTIPDIDIEKMLKSIDSPKEDQKKKRGRPRKKTDDENDEKE